MKVGHLFQSFFQDRKSFIYLESGEQGVIYIYLD